jgi:integrase
MLRGAWVDPREAGRHFQDVAHQWLESNPGKRPSAWARDESIVRVHLLPAFGREPIGKVTPDRVRAVVHAWSKQYKPRTVRRMYGVLRAVFTYAVESSVLVASPCRGVKLPGIDPTSRHVISADELALLAEELGADYASMAYLGAMLGLRWGEAVGLRVGRLDLLAGTLTVAEQVTRGPRGLAVFGPPKSTAGRRTLAVPADLVEMLAAHLARRGLTAAHPDALLFTAADGAALDYANFRHRVWLPACRRAGLVGFTFHDLRRANATALMRARVDLKTAQTRLGHSDPRLTIGVYAQATSDADRAAAAALGDTFARPPRDGRAMDSA